MTAPLLTRSGRIRARAHFLAARIDAGRFEGRETLRRPAVVRVGDGCAVVFRYGAVVTFGLAPEAEAAFLDRLRPALSEPLVRPEHEEVDVEVAEGREGTSPDGVVILADTDSQRLEIVAEVLARSTVLAFYEARVAEAVDRIEPLTEGIRGGRGPGVRERELLRHLGDALLVQTRTVGRVEVLEKPDPTWDSPDLDLLFERLRTEYELGERDRALSRKVQLVSDISTRLIELVQERRILRVEWYIVVLILVEIVLILYELLAGR